MTVARDILDRFAYSQGQQAFLDGLSDDANIYQRGTMLCLEWERGWDAECARFMDSQNGMAA